jgi:hypothetical protein
MDWESTAYESKSPKDIKYPEARTLPLSRHFPQMFKMEVKAQYQQ